MPKHRLYYAAPPVLPLKRPKGGPHELAIPRRPILLGNYAPLSFEADAPDLPLRGALPKGLAGTLYRNGPNPQFAPRDRIIIGSSATA